MLRAPEMTFFTLTLSTSSNGMLIRCVPWTFSLFLEQACSPCNDGTGSSI